MNLKLVISKQVGKSIDHLPLKHFKQVITKVLTLLEEPYPQDVKKIKANKMDYLRVDSGEYRIVYRVGDGTLFLVLIDQRNDDEVYKKLINKKH